MELRQLEYFATAARLGSVSKAASVLHLTQPSLSRQIRALETELGTELFERAATGVLPTAAGAGLLRHLDVVFSQIQRIPEVVRAASEGERIVRIGVPQGLPHDWFLDVLLAIGERAPSVTFSLHEATTEEQRRLVLMGMIDVALVHFDAPELASRELLRQRMGVVVEEASPLAERTVVSFEDLDGCKVMAHAAGEINAEETRLRSAAAAAGVDIYWIFRRFSEHSELIARTSRADAVLVTEASARRSFPDWSWVPFHGADIFGLDLGTRTWLAWQDPPRPALKEIIDLIVAAGRRDDRM